MWRGDATRAIPKGSWGARVSVHGVRPALGHWNFSPSFLFVFWASSISCRNRGLMVGRDSSVLGLF